MHAYLILEVPSSYRESVRFVSWCLCLPSSAGSGFGGGSTAFLRYLSPRTWISLSLTISGVGLVALASVSLSYKSIPLS